MSKLQRVILALCLLCLTLPVRAGLLSDQSKISLITCGQGQEMYAIFGHTAIRVQDSRLGYDIVYNYGVFDFSEPHFYVNFLRGLLNYYLAADSWEHFIQSYLYEGRAVYEQELNLSLEEREKLVIALENNLKPENRRYLYDFLRNNCTTCVRDMLIDKNHLAIAPIGYSNLTWRNCLANSLDKFPWTSLGIDMVIGANVDRTLSKWEEMFLPELLMQNAEILQKPDGSPFVSKTNIILEGQPIATPKIPHLPLYVSLSIVLCCIVLCKKKCLIFDRILFLVLGLMGCVMFFFWFFSIHFVAQTNYNIFWALPTHLLFVFFIRKKKTSIQKYYSMLTVASVVLFYILAITLSQTFPIEIFILALCPLIRGLNILYNNK